MSKCHCRRSQPLARRRAEPSVRLQSADCIMISSAGATRERRKDSNGKEVVLAQGVRWRTRCEWKEESVRGAGKRKRPHLRVGNGGKDDAAAKRQGLLEPPGRDRGRLRENELEGRSRVQSRLRGLKPRPGGRSPVRGGRSPARAANYGLYNDLVQRRKDTKCSQASRQPDSTRSSIPRTNSH